MDRDQFDRPQASARWLAVVVLTLALTIGGMSTAIAGSGSGSGSSGSGSGGSGGSGGSSSGGSFTLSANYQPPTFVGTVVRGGLASCPNCTTSVEPRYVGRSFSCFYDSNSLALVSLNDFRGEVTIEVIGLPDGVTSLTATKLVVPRRGSVSTPFRLQASSTATLGDATVTVRATGGGLVHTLSLPITISDQLPNC